MSTPKLRFKEFNLDWNVYTLDQISNIKTGPFGSTLHQEDYVESGTPIITVEHLGDFGLTMQNLPLVSDEDKIRLKSYILQEGDIAFSRVGSVDRCAIITKNEEGWLFSGRILRVKPNKKIVDSKNLMYALKTEETKYRIRSVAVGQTMPSLNTEILKNFTVTLSPSKEEQTKIASFLSAVDQKISQLSQKHELLSQYKQGMMQKLFSQQIRFKADDGSEFGEWERKTLGDITTLVSRRNKNDVDAEIYSVTNSQGFVKQNEYFEDRRIAGEDTSSYKIIKRNEFAYNPARINVGSIALFNVAEIGIISSLYVCFSVNESMKTSFLEYFLKLDSTIKNYGLYGEGGVRIYLWYPLFSKIPFNLPCLEEQTKIANFLSAIDQKIEVVAQQIEQAKTWKKGLLQQMFV